MMVETDQALTWAWRQVLSVLHMNCRTSCARGTSSANFVHTRTTLTIRQYGQLFLRGWHYNASRRSQYSLGIMEVMVQATKSFVTSVISGMEHCSRLHTRFRMCLSGRSDTVSRTHHCLRENATHASH